jgi:gamma-glutamyl hercynylcysteine S-oxide hydrolase
MCRLLGYTSFTERTTQSVLGGNQSAVFQDMTHLHKDGWGSAWLSHPADGTTGGAALVSRETSPQTGAGDSRLTAALTERESTAQIVHLRMATDGMACQPVNTHPFLVDNLSFAHNGSLTPTSIIDEHISADILAGLKGDTDSERYFAVIRTKLAEGADLFDAVCDSVSELRPLFPHASMNALILSPTQLIAVHASDGARVPVEDFDASGIADEHFPRDHRTAYYLMRQRTFDDGTIIFASSGLDIIGWEPLPSESVTSVDLHTREVVTRFVERSRTLTA